MRYTTFFILFLALCNTVNAVAQDTLTRLEEVLLSDTRLHRNSRSQVVTVLKDSVLINNDPLLGTLLKFNSPIYFRENGYGMVSSASFRGTTASQTAVIWNGININSQFNGQTDFNTLNTAAYDNIAVRSGGGSVLYGSGAIGGSVHLNNRFRFNSDFDNTLRLEYGSFNTRTARYSAEASSEKTSVYINVGGTSSDNDFQYSNSERFNENGDFYNISLSAGVAHWLNKDHILKFYSDHFTGERGFSGTLTAPSRSKFEDVNNRSLLEWKYLGQDFNSSLKFAYLDESYKYYENRNRESFSFGDAENYIINYDLYYKLTSALSINANIDYRYTDGKGSDVGKNSRDITAFALLLNHDLGRFFYELSARREITESYESPLLYAAGMGYAVTPFYDIHLNFSKNFRIPTYNDLFWRAGGNLELQAETSYQGELGQTLQIGKLDLGLVGYILEISNLLRWVPDASGLWRPVNTESVRNYGVELRGEFQEKINDHHHIHLNSSYAYTKTNDKNLDKELIYVPNHKATASLGYSYKDLSLFYQFLYNGRIYTSSDNNYKLPGYSLSNVGAAFTLGQRDFLKLGFEVRNIFDKYYESLPSRPMPGLSFNSSLTFNF